MAYSKCSVLAIIMIISDFLSLLHYFMLLLNHDILFNFIKHILGLSNKDKGNVLSSSPQIPETPNPVLNIECIANKYLDG